MPSSRSVPRCFPVRSAGPGDVEHVVEDLEGQADPPPERAEVELRLAGLERPERARGLEQPRGLQLAAQQVALERDRGVPGVGALQQLAARERRARVAEHADRLGSPGSVSAANARAKSRSPVAIASVAAGAGDDGRTAAAQARRASRTSSWTSVALCTSSTAAPARTRPSASCLGRAAPRPASSTSSGRSRLPPAAIVAPPCSASGRAVPGGVGAQALPRRARSSAGTCSPPARTSSAVSGVAARRVTPRGLRARVDRDDAAGGQRGSGRRRSPAAVEALGQLVRPGEALHRVRQVGVGVGVAGERARSAGRRGRTTRGRRSRAAAASAS